MWDDILKANPKLFIDDCASGGGEWTWRPFPARSCLEKRQYV